MSSRLLRISGFGLLAGSVAFVLQVVLRSVITAGLDPAVFAKHGAWVRSRCVAWWAPYWCSGDCQECMPGWPAPFGLPGLIGIVLLAAAWMFVALFLSLYSALVLPWLADRAPSLVVSEPLPAAFVIAFAGGLIGWCAGAVLLAIPFIRKRAQPPWVGYALVASAVWMVIGNLVIAPSGPASNLGVNLLSNLGPVLLLAGVSRLGYCMSWEPASTDTRAST